VSNNIREGNFLLLIDQMLVTVCVRISFLQVLPILIPADLSAIILNMTESDNSGTHLNKNST